MTFEFGTPPDPDKEGIMELHHYRQAVDDYDKDGGLLLASQCSNTGLYKRMCV